MVGTELEQRGGVATVLRAWRDQGLFKRQAVHYVATNRGSGSLPKVISAIIAWTNCLRVMVFRSPLLVHIHTSSFVSFWRKSPIMAFAIVLRVPFIVSLHGGAFQSFYDAAPVFFRAWIRFVMRSSARFVVLSNRWREWVLYTEPRARVEVIPNPAPTIDWPLPERADDSQPTLLFLGRIEHAKGIDVLLSALSIARARGASWHLVAAGVGDLAFAKGLQRRLGLAEHVVQWPGWADTEMKRSLFATCSALVLPSRIENMPVVILEAWACGRAVLSTCVGGIADMIEEGVNGWTCQSGEEASFAELLVRAWGAREQLDAMGLNGMRKVIAEYDLATVIERVETLYKTIQSEG